MRDLHSHERAQLFVSCADHGGQSMRQDQDITMENGDDRKHRGMRVLFRAVLMAISSYDRYSPGGCELLMALEKTSMG